jgi:hypothetical protein
MPKKITPEINVIIITGDHARNLDSGLLKKEVKVF